MPRDIVDFLEHSSLESITATPLGSVEDRYLEIVFADKKRLIRVMGAAADLNDRTEAFYLTAEQTGPEPRWVSTEGGEAWPKVDFREKWRSSPVGELASARNVMFYVDPDDRRRGMGLLGPFAGAAAIEFSSLNSEDEDRRVVFYAAPDYPCSVEVAIDLKRCDDILRALHPVIRAS